MKALSLWQPWSSAIVAGAKCIETRSYGTSYRGPLAIHAAKKRDSLITHMEGMVRGELGIVLPDPLPRGCVVAVVDLVGCQEMDEALIAEQSELERALGDWQEGRFAWHLENVRPVLPPVDTRGFQRMWNLPDLVTLDVMTFARTVPRV